MIDGGLSQCSVAVTGMIPVDRSTNTLKTPTIIPIASTVSAIRILRRICGSDIQPVPLQLGRKFVLLGRAVFVRPLLRVPTLEQFGVG